MMRSMIPIALVYLIVPPAAAQETAVGNRLMAELRNFHTLEGYTDRFRRFFESRDVDGVAGIGPEDERIVRVRIVEREQRNARKRLALHDIDGDGVATSDEIIQSLRLFLKIPEGPLSDGDQRRIDSNLRVSLKDDLDGDGSISLAETLARSESDAQNALEFETVVFKGLTEGADRDGDGIVHFEDVEHQLQIVFSAADSNGDGKLSRQEHNVLVARR